SRHQTPRQNPRRQAQQVRRSCQRRLEEFLDVVLPGRGEVVLGQLFGGGGGEVDADCFAAAVALIFVAKGEAVFVDFVGDNRDPSGAALDFETAEDSAVALIFDEADGVT